MPFAVSLAGVDVGSAPHQQHAAHYAQNHRDLRSEALNFKDCLSADGFEVEVIGQPAEDDQN